MSTSSLDQIAPVSATKACRRCGAIFSTSRCKVCAKASDAAYREKNRDKTKAKSVKWRKENPEKKKAANAKWYAENKDSAHLAVAAWKKSNKDKVKGYDFRYRSARIESMRDKSNAWRTAFPEKAKAAKDNWRYRNPGVYASYRQNRRALKAETGGKLTPGLSKKLFAMQRGMCPCCSRPLGENYHLDHVMPLALGGSNTDDNIQLLRSECNLRKHARHPVDFMQSMGFLL